MAFNSITFGLFLLISFFIYYLISPQKQWVFLLCINIIFYASYTPQHIFLLGLITLITYWGAIRIEQSHTQQAKRKWFITILICCLGFLIFFKYFNFFSTSLCSLASLLTGQTQTDPFIIQLLLPIGISFYTFQTVGYLIDVYRGQTPAERHLGIYAVFVSFFPQILSGPIGRGNQLLPQYHNHKTFQYTDVTYGLKLMAWGYFKKIVIADSYAIYVNMIYDSVNQYHGFSLFLATLMFTIQIYCDFSGYSDIAIGIARLFGIHIPQNFKSPYFASSIKDFWSRWHISLSQWLRDYLYIPLGGNRKGTTRAYLNLLITFVISGLWHGANWTYVLWGGIHGIGQIIEKVFLSTGATRRKFPPIHRIFNTLLTFAFCAFAWSFFRANSINDAIYILSNITAGISSPIAYLKTAYTDLSLSWISIFYLVLPLIPLTIFDYFSLRFDVIGKISALPIRKRWIIYIIFTLFAIFMMPAASGHQFIYFQF